MFAEQFFFFFFFFLKKKKYFRIKSCDVTGVTWVLKFWESYHTLYHEIKSMESFQKLAVKINNNKKIPFSNFSYSAKSQEHSNKGGS